MDRAASALLWSRPGKADGPGLAWNAGSQACLLAPRGGPTACQPPELPCPRTHPALHVLTGALRVAPAEEAVNEVKRQALSELQKAVSDAERKAHALISTERAKMERALAEAKRQASEDALTVVNQQEDSSEVGQMPRCSGHCVLRVLTEDWVPLCDSRRPGRAVDTWGLPSSEHTGAGPCERKQRLLCCACSPCQ